MSDDFETPEEMVERWERQDKELERQQNKRNGHGALGNSDQVALVAPGADAESGEVLLAEIEHFLAEFVIYPSEHARVAHVLWIAHTHLMDIWESTPRIAFLSPEPASGKTRALEISELLVPSPVQAVNVSPAYLFRKVGDRRAPPTVLFDEIDTIFGPKAKENEEVRGLLNAGHRRGAVAGRCVARGNVIEPEEIPAYCAVALAGLGWLPETIMSRSIIIRMRRRKLTETVKPFRRRIERERGHQLRDRLARWTSAIGPGVKWPEMPGIEDRNADVWEALFAVANAAGGGWPSRVREAAAALIGEARDTEPSLGIRLLSDLKIIFGNAQEMTTESILHALHSLPEAPWNDLKGKPLNDRGLALRLRQYSVKPKVIRIGNSTPRGYTRQDLIDVWDTYLPAAPSTPETSATTATSATETDVAHVADVAAGPEEGRTCAQCGGAPDGREEPFEHGGRLYWLHPQCQRFWLRENATKT